MPYLLSFLAILAALSMVFLRRPVHASLSFLCVLLMLSGLYLQLSSDFIALVQVLVYAGAILVTFLFILVIFQGAYGHIALEPPKSAYFLLLTAFVAFTVAMAALGSIFIKVPTAPPQPPEGFSQVQELGKSLYVDFFFPFEAVVLLFLVAAVGALYIARKEHA